MPQPDSRCLQQQNLQAHVKWLMPLTNEAGAHEGGRHGMGAPQTGWPGHVAIVSKRHATTESAKRNSEPVMAILQYRYQAKGKGRAEARDDTAVRKHRNAKRAYCFYPHLREESSNITSVDNLLCMDNLFFFFDRLCSSAANMARLL